MTTETSLLRVSVVIPTHNPRKDYLARVVDALRGQTLSKDLWELLIVDNGSRVPLAAAARLKDQKTAESSRRVAKQPTDKRPRDEEVKKLKDYETKGHSVGK